MTEHYGQTYKERIKALREGRGLTQEELAEKLGFTTSSVGKWEGGANNPGKQAARKLARFFNVNIEWLRTGRGPMREGPGNNSHNGNRETAYGEKSQSTEPEPGPYTLRSVSPDVNPKDEDSIMQASQLGSSPTIHVPEYLNITFLGEVIARVRISKIVLGLVKNVDVTKSLFGAGFSDTKEPLPEDE